MQSKSTSSIHVDQAVCRFAHLKNQSCFGFVFSALKPPHPFTIAAPINSALVFPSILDFEFKMHSEFMVIHLIKVVHNFVFFFAASVWFTTDRTPKNSLFAWESSHYAFRSANYNSTFNANSSNGNAKKPESSGKPSQNKNPLKRLNARMFITAEPESVCVCLFFFSIQFT